MTKRPNLSGIEPAAFVQADFAFYGTVLSGTPELKERWKRGVGLVNGVLGAVPPRHRVRATHALAQILKQLGAWGRATMLIMLVTGTITSLGFWALGVNNWLVFGILAALGELIPTLGPIAATIPPVLFTLADDPQKALFVLIFVVAFQQFESYVLAPFLIGGAGELVGQVDLVGCQDVDGKMRGLGKDRIAARPLDDAPEDQRRIQRYGIEAVGGHAHLPPACTGGHDGDTGGKVAQCPPEGARIDGRRLGEGRRPGWSGAHGHARKMEWAHSITSRPWGTPYCGADGTARVVDSCVAVQAGLAGRAAWQAHRQIAPPD